MTTCAMVALHDQIQVIHPNRGVEMKFPTICSPLSAQRRVMEQTESERFRDTATKAFARRRTHDEGDNAPKDPRGMVQAREAHEVELATTTRSRPYGK